MNKDFDFKIKQVTVGVDINDPNLTRQQLMAIYTNHLRLLYHKNKEILYPNHLEKSDYTIINVMVDMHILGRLK